MASAPTENRDLVYVGPAKRGRPSDYTEALGNEICARIAGNETLNAICADADMPDTRTVGRWLMRYADFAATYTRARATQMHLEAEEIRTIADDLRILPEHKRIMVDARKWRAERMNRGTYGNSIRHEHELPAAAPLVAGELPGSLSFLIEGGEG